jgi:hypothetical protein
MAAAAKPEIVDQVHFALWYGFNLYRAGGLTTDELTNITIEAEEYADKMDSAEEVIKNNLWVEASYRYAVLWKDTRESEMKDAAYRCLEKMGSAVDKFVVAQNVKKMLSEIK